MLVYSSFIGPDLFLILIVKVRSLPGGGGVPGTGVFGGGGVPPPLPTREKENENICHKGKQINHPQTHKQTSERTDKLNKTPSRACKCRHLTTV